MNTKISVGILNSDSTITCMIFNYTVFGKFMTQPKFMGVNIENVLYQWVF